VDLLDFKIDNTNLNELPELLKGKNPDIVCIDDDPRTHCNSILIIKSLRDFYGRDLIIMMRGEMASFIPQIILERNLEVDYVLRYDDDYALLHIIESLEGKRKQSQVYNIGYRDIDGRIVITEVSKNGYDINLLPMPDRQLYDINKYLRRDSETIVRSSRGCPGKCLFCTKTKFSSFKVFSVSRFCDEIEILLSYGFASFFFSDDTFAFSDERVDDFYREIKRRDLKFRWTSNIRIYDINEYKLKRMKEIGAYRVFVGIETVNGKTSEALKKNMDIQLIREKVNLIKKYGLEFHASFILGNPNDTEEDIEASIRFVKEVEPTIVTFNLIKIYPGLELYNEPEKYGVIMDDPYWFEKDDWSYKVVMGTKDLPPDRLEYLSRKCLFEFIDADK